jgi:hypothetical protein
VSDVQRIRPPDRARQLAGLERVDYADCFTVAVPVQRAPEEWIRLAIQALPRLFVAVRGAHRALGLRLAPADSLGHPIGWDVVRSDAEEAVLASGGRLGRPRIVGLTPPGKLVLATVIELNGGTGRSLWAVAAPVHRAVARYVLGALPTVGGERT